MKNGAVTLLILPVIAGFAFSLSLFTSTANAAPSDCGNKIYPVFDDRNPITFLDAINATYSNYPTYFGTRVPAPSFGGWKYFSNADTDVQQYYNHLNTYMGQPNWQPLFNDLCQWFPGNISTFNKEPVSYVTPSGVFPVTGSTISVNNLSFTPQIDFLDCQSIGWCMSIPANDPGNNPNYNYNAFRTSDDFNKRFYSYFPSSSTPPTLPVSKVGYGITASLPSYKNRTVEGGISSENAVIDQIAATANSKGVGKITIQVGSSTDPNKFRVDIAAKNCIELAGGEDASAEIVFVRGRGFSNALSVKDFMNKVDEMLNSSSGFRDTSPFSEYDHKLAYYADIQGIDERGLPMSTQTIAGHTYPIYNASANAMVRIHSSCPIGSRSNIIFITSNPSTYSGYAIRNGGVAYMTPNNPSISKTAIHEIGHAMGGLNDEYNNSDNPFGDYGVAAENCSKVPSVDFRSSIDNHLYGAVDVKGCFYSTDDEGAEYFRPSKDSIMHLDSPGYHFNVISCGYMISAILYESESDDPKPSAEKYWPECYKMADIDNYDLPEIADAPSVTSSSGSAYPGMFANVQGSGFSQQGNAIQLQNNSTGQIYDMPNLPSPNRNSVTFNVPKNLPTGDYTLKVGAFNSDWTYAGNFRVLASGETGDQNGNQSISINLYAQGPLGSNNVDVPAGDYTAPNLYSVSWTSVGADSCHIVITEEDKGGPWSGQNGSSGIANTVQGEITGQTTFTVSCTNSYGTATRSLTLSPGMTASSDPSSDAQSSTQTFTPSYLELPASTTTTPEVIIGAPSAPQTNSSLPIVKISSVPTPKSKARNSYTLTWSGTSASSCTLLQTAVVSKRLPTINLDKPKNVAKKGSMTLTVSNSTKFTVTCKNPKGSTSADTTITINNQGASVFDSFKDWLYAVIYGQE